MKKTKLSLKKVTITKLNNLDAVKGGFTSVVHTYTGCHTADGNNTCPDTGKTNDDIVVTEDSLCCA
ncbi:hypothetical protein U6A24_17920 [Aquimarina gracilis]|uniref:Natural product n=1 Tax=Aquimarina gracilis TaxID=874422 RepID=A0ABU5ZZV1_9FLAO|nr:hypothetical protein [Aquimarina gracilis]MEB3347358.1 hypothetical protein [Aquimarina gracilis]